MAHVTLDSRVATLADQRRDFDEGDVPSGDGNKLFSYCMKIQVNCYFKTLGLLGEVPVWTHFSLPKQTNLLSVYVLNKIR